MITDYNGVSSHQISNNELFSTWTSVLCVFEEITKKADDRKPVDLFGFGESI